jgi:hypothetical protein
VDNDDQDESRDHIVKAEFSNTLPNAQPVEPFTSIPTELKAVFVQALQIINSVHGDGFLEPLPIKFVATKALGGYQIDHQSKVPLGFVFRKGRSVQLETIIHEIAHALDHQVLGEDHVFASTSTELLGATDLLELMTAIANSQAYQTVQSYMIGQVVHGTVITKLREYYLDKREWFARAYVQYIAIRSGNQQLLDFVNRKNLSSKSKIVYPEAWSEQDFKPIKIQLQRLLIRKQWIK